MASEYEQAGHHLGRGLWSFVFMPTAEDDWRFFDAYSEHLNRTAGTFWHCVGFVRRQKTDEKWGWRSDRPLHERSNELRAAIKGDIISNTHAALVFFNPLSKLSGSTTCIVRLDPSRLHDQVFYKNGLDRVTKAVTATVQNDLDYQYQEEYHIDRRLRSLNAKLGVISKLQGVSVAVFGTAVPILMKMFLEHGAKSVGLKP